MARRTRHEERAIHLLTAAWVACLRCVATGQREADGRVRERASEWPTTTKWGEPGTGRGRVPLKEGGMPGGFCPAPLACIHPPRPALSLSLSLSLLSSSESLMGGFLDVTTPLPEMRLDCSHIAQSSSLMGNRDGRRVVESSSFNPISRRFVVVVVGWW